ncbi:hypothetical protein CCP3SC15_4030003 [Gammaproteobacteria bacterium]
MFKDGEKKGLRLVYPQCEPEGCGLAHVWMLPPDHPFNPACVWHDRQYDLLKPGESTERIDKIFYSKMLLLCGESKWLRLQAEVFYQLARRYGQCRWLCQRAGSLWA